MEQKPITVELYCNNSIEEKLKKYQKKHDMLQPILNNKLASLFSLFQIRKTFLADNKPRFIFVSQEAHRSEQDFFNDPENKRGHLEVGSFNNSWARRSTFTISKTNLLVTEIFLESLYA